MSAPHDAPTDPVIEVEDLAAGYGGRPILEHVSFEVSRGEVFGVLGGSGCGKTTILRHLIGLAPPLGGSIRILGQDLTNAEGAARSEILRQIGIGYQSGALFGSMTLRENVCIPLEEHTDLHRRAREYVATTKLEMVDLGGYEDFYPAEISGGMRKRAAIARALALDPAILFLDEPSAGLDPITSAGLDKLIVRLAGLLGVTFVIVTHELPSILSILDRCIVLDRTARGIIATGNPRELADHARHPIVRAFFRRTADVTDLEANT